METEADEVGLKLASKACFDVRQAPVFWAKMNAIAEVKGSLNVVMEFWAIATKTSKTFKEQHDLKTTKTSKYK